MKFAYLVSQYPAVNHTYILREVRTLRELGFDVQVISIGSPDRPPDRLTFDELQEAKATLYVKQTPLWRILQAHLAILFSSPWRYVRGLLYACSLGRLHPRETMYHMFYFVEAVVVGYWMLRRSLRHVHIHFSSTVGLIVARVFPITISLTIHGPDEFVDPTGFHLAEKVQAALFVCGISSFGMGQLMKVSDYRSWEKLYLSPLGVDLSVFQPRPPRDLHSSFQVMSVCRLAPVKGQVLLLIAMERLVKEGRRIRLRLVGDGPERRNLEGFVEAHGLSNHVVFEGFVNQDQLSDLYRECDVFVLPSFAEGVPVVLMESMAREIPCIATWVGGVPDLIRDGVDGLLVAPGDADSLAVAIRRLLDDPELRRRLGTQARQRILQKYDLRKNVGQLAGIFQYHLGPPSQATTRLSCTANVEHAIPHA